MTPKLPAISGDDLIKALGKFGYVTVRQHGSHVRMHHPTDAQRRQPLLFHGTRRSSADCFAALFVRLGSA